MLLSFGSPTGQKEKVKYRAKVGRVFMQREVQGYTGCRVLLRGSSLLRHGPRWYKCWSIGIDGTNVAQAGRVLQVVPVTVLVSLSTHNFGEPRGLRRRRRVPEANSDHPEGWMPPIGWSSTCFGVSDIRKARALQALRGLWRMEGRGPQRVYISSLQFSRRYPRSVRCGSLRLARSVGCRPIHSVHDGVVWHWYFAGLSSACFFPLSVLLDFLDRGGTSHRNTFSRDLDLGTTLQTPSTLRTMLLNLAGDCTAFLAPEGDLRARGQVASA